MFPALREGARPVPAHPVPAADPPTFPDAPQSSRTPSQQPGRVGYFARIRPSARGETVFIAAMRSITAVATWVAAEASIRTSPFARAS